jgi:serine/threonine protein kinase
MEMHSYATEQTLDLKLIGLHHDLKPDNVLVDDKLFILADFGLSTFKRSSQPSTSPFRMGGNDYVAPECEDLEHGFKKGTYNRSSDMWSFGCILAEVLTYMLHGGPGILEFRNRRGFKVNGWKLHTFHSCRANKVEVNEHVLQWLAEMEKSASLPGKQFIELIRKILSVVQEDRPTAVEVTQKLRFIAINEVLLPLAEQYNLTVSRVKSIQARLECERFRSWGHILGFINDECSSEQRAMVFELDFQSSITLLQETDAELRLIESRYDAATHPLFHELSRLNDKLMALLPEHMRKKARSYLELRVLSDISVETSDPESLGHLASLNGRGGMLSFIKRMTVLSVNRSRALALERAKKGKPDLRVETQAVELGTPFDDHCLAMIDDKSNPKKNVLIEWIKYDTHWEGPVETEMMNRVENITAYLNETAVSTQPLRLLHCIGYFHSIAEHAFGLVFELPYTIPKTLSTIISETRGTLDPPHLGDRFFLASTLASTLLDLHMATFYHKSIASHNIIFTSNNRPLLRDFHLIGFNHIRPTDPKAFTEGPPSSLNARRYQHPSYTTEAMRRGERFRLEYDYYSLGLVLLEIGLWDSVAGVKARSASELMEILLRKRVPLLGHCVGTAFREAVAKCMRGDFGRTEDLSSDNDVILEYEQVVVEPLRRLVA